MTATCLGCLSWPERRGGGSYAHSTYMRDIKEPAADNLIDEDDLIPAATLFSATN